MENKLNILWTSDNVITAEHMVMMYATNTLVKKIWDEVTVIIWGATSKLVAEDKHIQELIIDAQGKGVKFSACIACATNLGTQKALENLGIELIGWGKPLTEIIKNKEHLITV
ncbi:MAG: hypothetical protein ACJAWW_002543 [Sulfurimonas sp.]|jgi:hypothetical protein